MSDEQQDTVHLPVEVRDLDLSLLGISGVQLLAIPDDPATDQLEVDA